VPDYHGLWFPGSAWEPTAARLGLAWSRADGRRSLQEVRSQAEPGNENVRPPSHNSHSPRLRLLPR
jgi:hypothetical protein